MIDRHALILVFTKLLRADDEDLDDEDDLVDDDEGNGDDDEDEDEYSDEPETWQVSAPGPYCAKGCLLLDFG